MVDIFAGERVTFYSGHVFGYGRDDFDLYANFSTHLHAIWHEPHDFWRHDADQLRTGIKYASSRHDSICRLRHWRHFRRAGDANYLAVLWSVDCYFVLGDLCASIFIVAT